MNEYIPYGNTFILIWNVPPPLSNRVKSISPKDDIHRKMTFVSVWLQKYFFRFGYFILFYTVYPRVLKMWGTVD